MPHIIFQAAQLPGEVKNELMISLTETASKITGIPASSYTVLVQEHPMENWCIGGTPLLDLIKNAHK